MRDIHTELELDKNIDYLIAYFKDLNQSSREISQGDTLTKALVIAHKIQDELKSGLKHTD